MSINAQQLGDLITKNWIEIVKKQKIVKPTNIPSARVSQKTIIETIRAKTNLKDKEIKKLITEISEDRLIKWQNGYTLGETSMLSVIKELKIIEPTFDDKAYLERLSLLHKSNKSRRDMRKEICDINSNIIKNYEKIKSLEKSEILKMLLNLCRIHTEFFEKKTLTELSMKYLNEIISGMDINAAADKIMRLAQSNDAKGIEDIITKL